MQDFAKIDEGLLALEPVPIDIRSVLSGALLLILPLALERGVTLEYEISNGVPVTLIGDPVRIQQVRTVLQVIAP